MDDFKYLADLMHLLAFVILIWNMISKANCRGISYRTQELFLVIFLVRYSDMLIFPQRTWNMLLKFAFIILTAWSMYLIKYQKPISVTYDALMDTFPHRTFLIPACLVVSFFQPIPFPIKPWYLTLNNFTLVLEAFAFLPQLRLQRKIKEVEIITGSYIFCQGIYRFIYLQSWIWRLMYHEDNMKHLNVKVVCGVIQTLQYVDFIVQYLRCVSERKKYIILPM